MVGVMSRDRFFDEQGSNRQKVVKGSVQGGAPPGTLMEHWLPLLGSRALGHKELYTTSKSNRRM